MKLHTLRTQALALCTRLRALRALATARLSGPLRVIAQVLNAAARFILPLFFLADGNGWQYLGGMLYFMTGLWAGSLIEARYGKPRTPRV